MRTVALNLSHIYIYIYIYNIVLERLFWGLFFVLCPLWFAVGSPRLSWVLGVLLASLGGRGPLRPSRGSCGGSLGFLLRLCVSLWAPRPLIQKEGQYRSSAGPCDWLGWVLG